MGLDMYLNATRSFSGYDYEGPERKKEFKQLMNSVGSEHWADRQSPYATVTFTVGYWRKMNAVHGWFARNCGEPDNDVSMYVSKDDLIKLKNDCASALLKMPTKVPVSIGTAVSIKTDNPFEAIKDLITAEAHSAEFNDSNDDDPLRPTAGFFFGSTEKDDWYYDGLRETINIVDKALSLPDEWRFRYEASY
jgi:hypothetical protein